MAKLNIKKLLIGLEWVCHYGDDKVFTRLAQQHRNFVQDLVMSLQALAIALESRGYLASCYTCGTELDSASFMVSLGENHLIRFLVSDYGITWTEMRDERELMKLEGAEAISQLQELANMIKYHRELPRDFAYKPLKSETATASTI
jgi:hypothetical protein